MKNTVIDGRGIVFSRKNELVRITPCHKNAVRFEAFPDCREFDENYSLMPQDCEFSVEERDYCVFLRVGAVSLQLEENGKVTISLKATVFPRSLSSPSKAGSAVMSGGTAHGPRQSPSKAATRSGSTGSGTNPAAGSI